MKQKLGLFLASILLAAVVTGAARFGAPERSPEAASAERGIVSAHVDYRFVGDRGEVDAEGRRLVFEATVEGDVTGVMRWWFGESAPAPRMDYDGGFTDYYEARWELRDGGELVLAGESAGKTFYLDGEAGIWDGHGVVTEGYGPHAELVGRHYYETGPVVDGPNPPVTMHGTAMIVIH